MDVDTPDSIPASSTEMPPTSVKPENDALVQSSAPDTFTVPTLPPPPPTKDGLSKKDYEVMSKIVKYLTEYKNEEYVQMMQVLLVRLLIMQ